MASPPGNGHSFKVEFVSFAMAQLRHLAQRAIFRNRGHELAKSIREAINRLKMDSIGSGEPLYRLHHMKMLVCRGVFPPLYLEYGVHEDRPVVIIRHVAGLADAID